jgi:glycosyltransferase involved in cell wall biosynthesis
MLRPYKGIERLIEEWRNVASLHPGDTLVIAGKSQDAGYLARLTALAADSHGIQIREGFVPDSEVPVYFSAADLVVLPFSATLTSGSLLLAMSYGKPVIAPRFETIAETLGAAGDLLYDPEDPRGLRNSLEQSTSSHLGNLGRRTEQECDRLDWGAIAELTLRAYREALTNRS